MSTRLPLAGKVVSGARGVAGSADSATLYPAARLAAELDGTRRGAGRACAGGVVRGENFVRNAAAFGDGVAVLAGPCPQCSIVCPGLGSIATMGATGGAATTCSGGGASGGSEERGECLAELSSVSGREVDLEVCSVERERNGFVGLPALEVIDEPDGLDLYHWLSFRRVRSGEPRLQMSLREQEHTNRYSRRGPGAVGDRASPEKCGADQHKPPAAPSRSRSVSPRRRRGPRWAAVRL